MAHSSKSSLTVEINKCKNAITSLKSFQTSINEAINDLIVKTESIINNTTDQKSGESQKYLLRHKLKKAYYLLKEYESFLDSGPWKYSDDLEDFFKFVSPPLTCESSIAVPDELQAIAASVERPTIRSEDLDELFKFVSAPETHESSARSVHDELLSKPLVASEKGPIAQSDDTEDFIKFMSPALNCPPSLTVPYQSELVAGSSGTPVVPAAVVEVPKVLPDVVDLTQQQHRPIIFSTGDRIPPAVVVETSNVLSDVIEFTDVERLANELYNGDSQTAAIAVPNGELYNSDSDDSCRASSSSRQIINRWNICEVGLDTITECEVSHIESPSFFWCRNRPCVDIKIEEELIDHLRQMTQEQRVLRHAKLKEYCAAPYQMGYRRGRILELKTNLQCRQFAKILFIDHGNKVWVAADRLLILPSMFYHYQWQAALCRLYGLEPVVNDAWSFDVVSKFREFCEYPDLYLYAMDLETPSNHASTVKVLRKWEEGEDEELVKHEEYAHDELYRRFNASVKLIEQVPSRRFRCSFEESSVLTKEPPANPEPWQVEFNYAVLASCEEDVDLSGICAEEDTFVRPSQNEKETTSGGQANRPPYKQGVNVVRGLDIPAGTYKLDGDGFLHFNLLKVVNPDEFYVAPCDPDPQLANNNRETFRKFTEELTEFYSHRDNLLPVDFSTIKECPYAAAQLASAESEDAGNFYRCRVKESYYPDRNYHERTRSQFPVTDIRQDLKLTVFFVDLGRTEVMKPTSEVFLLDKRFCNLPAQVLKCNLFSSRPVEEGLRTTFGNWRPETVEEFKKLCKFDRPMKATILMEETDRFGIVLFDVDASDRPIIINHELMKKGLVRSDIIWVSFMAEQLRKLGESLNNQRQSVRENVHEFDPFSQPGPSRILSYNSEQREPLIMRCIEPPEKGSIVDISVTCLFSCLKFPVTFPFGTADSRKTNNDPALKAKSLEIIRRFENLCKEINFSDPRFLAQLPVYKSQDLPNIGDYCLSVFTEDKKLYRAQIIESFHEDDQYRVKYVDYGNMEYVHLKSLRPITEDLLRVPIISLECHLADVRATEAASLQENMNILWEKIYRKPQKARIIDVIKRPLNNPLLIVDLRATDVDNSYIRINNFVVEQGWAVSV